MRRPLRFDLLSNTFSPRSTQTPPKKQEKGRGGRGGSAWMVAKPYPSSTSALSFFFFFLKLNLPLIPSKKLGEKKNVESETK